MLLAWSAFNRDGDAGRVSVCAAAWVGSQGASRSRGRE